MTNRNAYDVAISEGPIGLEYREMPRTVQAYFQFRQAAPLLYLLGVVLVFVEPVLLVLFAAAHFVIIGTRSTPRPIRK
jgi:hypothetical protein